MPELFKGSESPAQQTPTTEEQKQQSVNDASVSIEDLTANSAVSNEKESSNIKGLSGEEQNDPNKISVNIADRDTPIVVLFGPPACGKTMTLIRLTRYLKRNGFTVSPVRDFRPAADKNYQDICNNFDEMIANEDAASSTNQISFMLVQVLYHGRTLCQILEAPGEHYYNGNLNESFPKYVNAIISSNNRKIWAIMVEPYKTSMMDKKSCEGYVDRIARLKRSMSPRDRVTFVFNKIDETPYQLGMGKVNFKEARKDISNRYPGIFNLFKNENPITKLWREYYCDFTAFMTGTFQTANDGTLTYQEGPDNYPALLWKLIRKNVRG